MPLLFSHIQHCIVPQCCLNYRTMKAIYSGLQPASVAQLDARPTGDQEVVGSTPAEFGNILS